jgi:hypothetical protein
MCRVRIVGRRTNYERHGRTDAPWRRSEVYLFLRTDLILAVPFLRQCSPDIVHELVLRLREEVGRLVAPPRRLFHSHLSWLSLGTFRFVFYHPCRPRRRDAPPPAAGGS